MATVEQMQQVFGEAVATMGQAMVQVLQHPHKQQLPQLPQAGTPAQTAQSAASEKQQLTARGFENIEVFAGGEDTWQKWLWKVRGGVQ